MRIKLFLQLVFTCFAERGSGCTCISNLSHLCINSCLKMYPYLKLKYSQFPLKITTNLQTPCAPNPAGLLYANHLCNNLAHLASRREINDMNNLYNNPPKMKELRNKSTCIATLIYCSSTMLIGSHAVSSHKICSYRLIITVRYAIIGRMYFKSRHLCDWEGCWGKKRWHWQHAWTFTSSCLVNCDNAGILRRGEPAPGGARGLIVFLCD